MKKLIVLFTLALLLTTFGSALAYIEFDDPALCVDGQWLLVNAADQSAVHVFLPQGTPYGDEGGCTTEPPAPVFIKDVVVETGRLHTMFVTVDGKKASETVTVSYEGKSRTLKNHGWMMLFPFSLAK